MANFIGTAIGNSVVKSIGGSFDGESKPFFDPESGQYIIKGADGQLQTVSSVIDQNIASEQFYNALVAQLSSQSPSTGGGIQVASSGQIVSDVSLGLLGGNSDNGPATYKLSKDDSFYSIAREKLGEGADEVDVIAYTQQLIEVNPGLDPRALQIGSVINLASGDQPVGQLAVDIFKRDAAIGLQQSLVGDTSVGLNVETGGGPSSVESILNGAVDNRLIAPDTLDSVIDPIALGKAAGINALERVPSLRAEKLAQKFGGSDILDRENKYDDIGIEFTAAGNIGAAEWFFAASDQVKSINLAFEGKSSLFASSFVMGEGAFDSREIILKTSSELAVYNFQSYLDIKENGSIPGLEGLEGRNLALAMVSYEQVIAQRLFNDVLTNSDYSANERRDISSSINERFNGSFDRAAGSIFPSYVSDTITPLNNNFPNQDFDFTLFDDRLKLGVDLINNRFDRLEVLQQRTGTNE